MTGKGGKSILSTCSALLATLRVDRSVRASRPVSVLHPAARALAGDLTEGRRSWFG